MSDEAGPYGGIVPPHITERLEVLKRSCPACHAKPMEPCTVPTGNGRREVKWFHLQREFPFDESEDC